MSGVHPKSPQTFQKLFGPSHTEEMSLVPTRTFSVPGFFFGYAHALAPLVVAYAPKGSSRGLPTERRLATSGSEKY